MRSRISIGLCMLTGLLMAGCGGNCSSDRITITPSKVFYAQTGATTISKIDSSAGVLSTLSIPAGYATVRFNANFTQFVAQTNDGTKFSLFTIDGVKIRDLASPTGLSLDEVTLNSGFTAITTWSFPGGGNIIRIDGGAFTPLANKAEDTNPTLDRILRTSVGSIQLSNIDGSGPLSISAVKGLDRHQFSPDGTKIAASRNSGGIYVVNTDGTGGRTVATSEPTFFFLWTPDSQSVIYFVSSTDPFEWGTSVGTWRILNLSTGVDRNYYSRSTLLFSSCVAPTNEPLE